MPPSMAAYGPAHPPTPRLRQGAGGQRSKRRAARHFGAIAVSPSVLIWWKQRRLKRGHDGAQPRQSVAKQVERTCAESVRQSKATLSPSSRADQSRADQKPQPGCRVSVAHQPTVKGWARVGWRDRMPPWMAAYELTWTYLQRVPRTHPCPPNQCDRSTKRCCFAAVASRLTTPAVSRDQKKTAPEGAVLLPLSGLERVSRRSEKVDQANPIRNAAGTSCTYSGRYRTHRST